MSYVSECVARGRSLFQDALNGIQERPGLRWVLVLPLVLIGSAVARYSASIYSFYVAGWAFDDRVEIFNPPERALPVFGPSFVLAYTWVVLAAIVAPQLKKTAAIASVPFFGVLLFLCRLWLRRSTGADWLTHWIWYLFFGEDSAWLGMLGGIALALVLVFWRARQRVMLTLPAYFFGFVILALPGSLILEFFLRPGGLNMNNNWAWNSVVFVGGFGSVGMAALMSPSHRIRTAIIFIAVMLAYVANSVVLYFSLAAYPAFSGMDIPGSTVPALMLGALAALGLVILRGKKASLPVGTLLRADPGNK